MSPSLESVAGASCMFYVIVKGVSVRVFMIFDTFLCKRSSTLIFGLYWESLRILQKELKSDWIEGIYSPA